MTQALKALKAPEASSINTNVPINLRQLATTMMHLTPSEISLIRAGQPQRDIAQIILVIGIHLPDISIVKWVTDNHSEVVSKAISNDTWSVVSHFGINPPQSS